MRADQTTGKSRTGFDLRSWLWLALASLSFYTFFFGYKGGEFWLSFVFSCTLLPATIATAYYVNKVLIPRYYFTKRWGWFGLYLAGALIFSSWLIIASYTVSFYLIADLRLINLTPMGRDLIFVIIAVYLVVISNAVVSLLRETNRAITENQRLSNEVLETNLKAKVQELQYLKNQIKPHFLFNSLNTLYGMALKKSEATPDAIVKLSNLLDYVLYQPADQLVTLARELEHIKDYIELEKIRFGDKLLVDLDIEGELEAVMLPPMLLIPFIENSFKHGGKRDGKHAVEIKLQADTSHLAVEIRNYQKEQAENDHQGIGLSNTQRRLQLLYGEHQELEISSEADWYAVKLRLDWREVKENRTA
ncbi:MAG: histidine kinase [Roseivirga sp.]|nr:histidine kinase [Roseivirga sp.]